MWIFDLDLTFNIWNDESSIDLRNETREYTNIRGEYNLEGKMHIISPTSIVFPSQLVVSIDKFSQID